MNAHKLFFIYRKMNIRIRVFGHCRLSSLYAFFFLLSFVVIFSSRESSGRDLCFVFCCLNLRLYVCVPVFFSFPLIFNEFLSLSMANDNESMVNRNYSAFVDNLINDLENETVCSERRHSVLGRYTICVRFHNTGAYPQCKHTQGMTKFRRRRGKSS